ncbi:hypothetical protein ACVIGB_000507 [Bradyrhizobium sp. USDA 4341]
MRPFDHDGSPMPYCAEGSTTGLSDTGAHGAGLTGDGTKLTETEFAKKGAGLAIPFADR